MSQILVMSNVVVPKESNISPTGLRNLYAPAWAKVSTFENIDGTTSEI